MRPSSHHGSHSMFFAPPSLAKIQQWGLMDDDGRVLGPRCCYALSCGDLCIARRDLVAPESQCPFVCTINYQNDNENEKASSHYTVLSARDPCLVLLALGLVSLQWCINRGWVCGRLPDPALLFSGNSTSAHPFSVYSRTPGKWLAGRGRKGE